mgnify:CR=1 FL=1
MIQLLVIPALIAVTAIIGWITFPAQGHGLELLAYGIFLGLCALSIFVIGLVSAMRRLRDAGQSPLWVILTVVPAVSMIAWLVIGILPTKLG